MAFLLLVVGSAIPSLDSICLHTRGIYREPCMNGIQGNLIQLISDSQFTVHSLYTVSEVTANASRTSHCCYFTLKVKLAKHNVLVIVVSTNHDHSSQMCQQDKTGCCMENKSCRVER